MSKRSTTKIHQPAPPFMRQGGSGKKNGTQSQQVRVTHTGGLRQNNMSISPLRYTSDTGERIINVDRNVAISPSINPSGE